MGRNTELGLQFSLPYLFGGAPVMAHGDLGIPDATGLEGRTVCVQAGTTIERIIANYLQTNGFTTNIISYESTAELQSAYLANRCDAFAGWGRTLQCCALQKSTTLTRMSFRTINCPASRLQRPQFFIWDDKYDNDPRTVNQIQVPQADHSGGPDNDCIVGCGVVRRSTLRHWASDVYLGRGTVWNYSFSLVEHSINDPYLRTFLIGFGNTLFLGFISIILSTFLV